MERSLPYPMLVIFFCFVGFVRCDFASDSAECMDQLIGLTNCLTFIEGSAKKATPECCSNLKQVLGKSKKCLCVLVKDRNEPGLGFKVNATLAMKLPGACNAPVNISECVDLLHLNPKSAEAQIFEQFERTLTATNKTTNVAAVNGVSSGPNGGSIAAEKSGRNDMKRQQLASKMVTNVWIWCLASLMIMGS
ncbi:hypothetical protein AAC387_Pa02g1031 [Persea americana]